MAIFNSFLFVYQRVTGMKCMKIQDTLNIVGCSFPRFFVLPKKHTPPVLIDLTAMKAMTHLVQ